MIVYVYEIQESQLDKLSEAAEGDRFLNMGIASLSIFITTAMTLAASDKLVLKELWWGVFIASLVLSIFFGASWWKRRYDKEKLVAQIKSQIEKVPVKE